MNIEYRLTMRWTVDRARDRTLMVSLRDIAYVLDLENVRLRRRGYYGTMWTSYWFDILDPTYWLSVARDGSYSIYGVAPNSRVVALTQAQRVEERDGTRYLYFTLNDWPRGKEVEIPLDKKIALIEGALAAAREGKLRVLSAKSKEQLENELRELKNEKDPFMRRMPLLALRKTLKQKERLRFEQEEAAEKRELERAQREFEKIGFGGRRRGRSKTSRRRNKTLRSR